MRLRGLGIYSGCEVGRSGGGYLLYAEGQAERHSWNGCTAVRSRSPLPAAHQLGEPEKPLNVFFMLLCLVAQSGPTLCNPMDYNPSRLLCPWGFSRQEYQSGLPCSPPGDLPNSGTKSRSPTLPADSLPFEPPLPPPSRAGPCCKALIARKCFPRSQICYSHPLFSLPPSSTC